MAVDEAASLTNSTTGAGSLGGHSGDASLAIIYALIIALVVTVPSVLALVLTYRFRLKHPDKPFVSGLSRTTMTIGIIATVGIALGHILVRGLSGTETSQLVTAIVSALLGALASMVGFYFGQKSVGGDAPPPGGKPQETPATGDGGDGGPPMDQFARRG